MNTKQEGSCIVSRFILLVAGVLFLFVGGCGEQNVVTPNTNSPGTGGDVNPVSQTISQFGTGISVAPTFTVTDSGNVMFDFNHDGGSNFIVQLKNNAGTIVDLLVNEIGSFAGQVDTSLAPGEYHLSVNADGNWTANITGYVTASSTAPVSGDPASIELSVAVNTGAYRLVAMVIDGSGNRVTDGTPVTFTASPSSVNISQSATTTNGVASVLFEPVSAGATTLVATTNNGITKTLVYEQSGPPANVTINSALGVDEVLPQNGMTTITAEVLDVNNQPVADGTIVNFSVDKGTISPTSAQTINGKATVNFIASGISRTVQVTVTVDPDDGSAIISQSMQVEVETGVAASVLLESVQPSTIGIKGSGREDTALITYRILDAAGNPALDGIDVNFEIVTATGGGEALTASSAKTAGGKVSVSLRSGTTAGTVAVKASTVDDSDPNNLVTVSTIASVSMVSNRPDSDRISLGAETLNLAGGVTLGLQSVVRAYLGDHAGNVPPDGTPVSFYSECGTIGESTGFETSTTFGIANATLQTSSPTVPDLGGLPYTVAGVNYPGGNVGLCRVMAMTPGKGAFRDLNGNGVFDQSVDVCETIQGEPYVDANDSAAYEPGEFYVDVNDNGQFDADVIDCNTDGMIWTSSNLMISDHVGALNIVPTSFEIPIGESRLITFSVADLHKNSLVAGTKVFVSLNSEALAQGASLVGTTTYEFPDTVSLGRDFAVSLASNPTEMVNPVLPASPTPATITVTVTPPGDANNNGTEINDSIIGMINAAVANNDNDTLASGDPASVAVLAARQQISVTGVGQIDRTTLSIKVTDDSGQLIDESLYNDPTLNNIQVRLITSPHGGEYVAGEARDAAGQVVVVDSRSASSVMLRTVNGEATLNLHSGTLPGNVEVQVRALYDAVGNLLVDPVFANASQVTIASGPPHTIVLTSARTASVQNLGNGVYRRSGTVMVTDRYGNTVSDGTTVYLGLGDTVLVEGTATNVSGSTVTSVPGIFDSTVTRNEAKRGIQYNDRMVLRGVPSQDKNRHVTSAGNGSLSVQVPYSLDYSNKEFAVVASLLGGSIGGLNSTGQAITENGLADIYVTYPANPNTIGVGCGSVPQKDLRHAPRGSAKVFVVAESTGFEGDNNLDPNIQFNDRATIVDEGQFCFAPVAGFTLEVIPATKLTGTGQRTIELTDGGDDIYLPYWPVTSYVAYDNLVKKSVCRKTGANQGSCTGATEKWLDSEGVCFDTSKGEFDCFNVTDTTTTPPTVSQYYDWLELTSDLRVDAYVNPFTLLTDMDIDSDGFTDIFAAGDVDGNGIPDDLNNDGDADLFDGDVVGWKFNAGVGRFLPDYPPLDAGPYTFFTYPYTFEGGNATALVVVNGEFTQTGDAATVTLISGDSEATIKVDIP